MATQYTKQFKIIFGLGVVVVFIGATSFSAFLVRYSATSRRVCGQCHEELVELWKTSNGHPSQETKCYQCHSKAFRISFKGWDVFTHVRDQLAPPEYLADDDRTNQRCLDCHEVVLNPGYELKKKIIMFNHRFHQDEGLNCVDCHRGAGHEYMTNGTNRPTVSECLNCHLKEFSGPPKNQKCLNCHEVLLVPGKDW